MTFADGEFLSQQRLDGLGAHGSLKHHRVAAIFRQTFRSAAARAHSLEQSLASDTATRSRRLAAALTLHCLVHPA